MTNPTIGQLDNFRKNGFRPNIVACIIMGRKLLFVYKKEHDLWQLPQGGIDNQENLVDAFLRELTEELGEEFIKTLDANIKIIGEDIIEFPPTTQGDKDLITDAGEKIFMKGKKYFFAVANSRSDQINVTETQFDDYKWADYKEAINLANHIYQKGKKRITLKIIDCLKSQGFLDG